VVQDLYELTDPESPRNPFRNQGIARRNRALHLLYLHQGLRRGEACSLEVNAVKEGTDPRTGERRHWLDVVECPDHAQDPRADRPSIKTEQSIRQIPVSLGLVDAIDLYTSNYRGRQEHSFLFSSQEGRPLALGSVNALYKTLSTPFIDRGEKGAS
jgi:integrase